MTSASASVRVLHLNTARTWRGGEQQVLYLVKGLRDLGVTQAVSGMAGSVLQERILEEEIPFHESNPKSELDFKAAKRIARFMKENRYTILHAHTGRAHAIGLLTRRFFAKDIKLIVSRRVDFPAKPNFLSKKKYTSGLIDRYIAISDNVKRILMIDGVAPERISVAYSGIDPDRFADLPDPSVIRTEFMVPENKFIFLNVAALVDHKDQSVLLAAAKILMEQGRDYRLFIAGEGSLRSKLENLIEKYALGAHVTLTGFRKDVVAFLSAADCFVMSSKEEGLGTSVLDAMACSLPVVTTDGGGLPEMVDHGKGGFVVPKRNPHELARAMAAIMDNSRLLKKAGKYNRKRVEDFHYKETAKATMQVYKETAGNY